MTTDEQPKVASLSASSSGVSISQDSATTTTTTTTATKATANASPRPRSKHSHSSSNVSKRRVPRPNPSEFLSDRATAQLIRRVLCPQQASDRGRTTPPPIDELLPPLTSRNDIDLQLYAILSIVLRDFVQTWYNKITPDETFVAEIIQIIAHCTRGLEQRLRKVDVESLLFDEIPDLFNQHVHGQPIVLKHQHQGRIRADNLASVSGFPRTHCPASARSRRTRHLPLDVPSTISLPRAEARQTRHHQRAGRK